ncbi:hypothetical protein [Micromonospora sp. DT47]|uniref:hypothetical protein n=1 Tax=Micromonospora sp. DT47 TaxID=3393431 RepID=UPI003CEA2943
MDGDAALVVQRVRVRWGSRARGAPDAALRRSIPQAYRLPQPPDERILVHEVLADETTGYQPVATLSTGAEAAREAGLWIELADGRAVVDRLPGRAAYPLRRISVQLFTLEPGQVGRYRANFRFTGCACAPAWHFEQWTVHVAYAVARPELFLNPTYARDVDDRVHLYGGTARRG